VKGTEEEFIERINFLNLTLGRRLGDYLHVCIQAFQTVIICWLFYCV